MYMEFAYKNSTRKKPQSKKKTRCTHRVGAVPGLWKIDVEAHHNGNPSDAWDVENVGTELPIPGTTLVSPPLSPVSPGDVNG